MGVLLRRLGVPHVSGIRATTQWPSPKRCCYGKEHRPWSRARELSGCGVARARRSVSPSTERANVAGRGGVPGDRHQPTCRPLPARHPGGCARGRGADGLPGSGSSLRLPPPPSLIRAYSLPDAPYPSILLKEHGDAPAGTGDAYRRFAAHARPHWLAALQETGPGLVPALAWQTGPDRRFVAPDEWAGALGSAGHRRCRAWPMIIWGVDYCCWPTRISRTRGMP